MQSIEAILSLLVFLSIAAYVLSADPGPPPIDDSLYRMQLADDAWRVLYLRGNFQDLDESKRTIVESDMSVIGKQTGLCLFMRGIEFTNCRGGDDSHDSLISIRRTVIYNRAPTVVTFRLSSNPHE